MLKKVTVNCRENDYEDIKYGGPYWLGFDFVVDGSIDVEELTSLIKEECIKAGHGFNSINIREIKEPKVWTKEEIVECIKTSEL